MITFKIRTVWNILINWMLKSKRLEHYEEFTKLTYGEAKRYIKGSEGQRVRALMSDYVDNIGGSVLDISMHANT